MSERQRGQFVVSIDFEMAWGLVHRNGDVDYTVDDERVLLTSLLDSFDRHSVPATWATVGHLLLDSCADDGDGLHPDISRPEYSWFRGDWFDADPGTDVHDAPRWYAPDVVTDLLARPAGHELGCHSFSHLIVGDPACSAADFESELVGCAGAAARFGVELESFVYPRNSVGHVDELVRAGYTNYRGRRADPFDSSPIGRARRLMDRVVPSPRSIVRPVAEPGIWNLPATCLFTIEARRMPELWFRQTLRRLEHAARHGGLFHVWFHPHNFAHGGPESVEMFDRLLARAAELRLDGTLDTVTMGSLSAALGEPIPA